MEARTRLVFYRAIEGIYTNCRKPVVQKEGINYCGTSNFALKAENILRSFIHKNKSPFDFIPTKIHFFWRRKATTGK